MQLFEDPNVSVDQLSEFYKVEGRPHTYLMFVTTIDGIAVPLELGQRGGSEIALRQLKNNPIGAGGFTDNRALQYGWATADAVLGGAGILRDNPDTTWYPRDKDLQELVTKRSRKPVRAVATGRGEIDLKHPVFNPKKEEWQPLIFTTSKGEERVKNQVKRLQVEGHKFPQSLKIFAIGEASVDLTKTVGILRKEFRTELLDIQGGPILAGGAVKAMLVDELRLTVSPQIMGDLNSEGKKRPGFVTSIHFGIDDSPLAELEAIGVSGSHIFLRYLMNYRN
ncbi:MAG TPA: dihydrofolate reductase family protein [Candidatus Bathyarchaeia archaeon]|nr:dihydrofolate reductase family protein [Candidatus Bathyarchaeia archaeon]